MHEIVDCGGILKGEGLGFGRGGWTYQPDCCKRVLIWLKKVKHLAMVGDPMSLTNFAYVYTYLQDSMSLTNFANVYAYLQDSKVHGIIHCEQ